MGARPRNLSGGSRICKFARAFDDDRVVHGQRRYKPSRYYGPMARRVGNFVDLASRFGWAQALTVMALWTARQAVGYRRAVIYSLDLDRIPSLSSCDKIDWR